MRRTGGRRRRVLVVEDDAHVRLGLVETLRSERYEVVECADGAAALDAVRRERPDLVLLDVMLPGRSGYDLLRDLRARGAGTPVILVTAKGEELDKIVGLKLGADDYVTKPFGVQELLARVEAVLRRTAGPERAEPEPLPEEIAFGSVRLAPASLRGRRGDEAFELTPRELEVLALLWREAGRVVERQRLLDEVWGTDYLGTTRTLDQVILRLRHKLETDPANPRHIRTVHRAGYRFEP